MDFKSQHQLYVTYRSPRKSFVHIHGSRNLDIDPDVHTPEGIEATIGGTELNPGPEHLTLTLTDRSGTSELIHGGQLSSRIHIAVLNALP
jgi:hypothetical protein